MANDQRPSDRLVGEALRRLRDSRSQQDVATEMQAEGWDKWSQSTVWSVEKGDRPLRLLEAAALAAIFGVQVEEFYTPDDHGVLAAARPLDLALSHLAGEFLTVERAHQRLLDTLEARPPDADGPVPEWVTYLADLTFRELRDVADLMKDGQTFPSVELGWPRGFQEHWSSARQERRGDE